MGAGRRVWGMGAVMAAGHWGGDGGGDGVGWVWGVGLGGGNGGGACGVGHGGSNEGRVLGRQWWWQWPQCGGRNKCGRGGCDGGGIGAVMEEGHWSRVGATLGPHGLGHGVGGGRWWWWWWGGDKGGGSGVATKGGGGHSMVACDTSHGCWLMGAFEPVQDQSELVQ
ncbi:hypothetical protein K439DRAFT_1610219 [Ramaria rubella]|nr:hypothetical protein K439DRAFT_1610219 [Ramaria rubella]